MKPYRLALLACSAKKLSHAAPARELYQGDTFKLALRVAERLADEVLILSAKHGVVELGQLVEPYDVKLSDLEKHQRAIWGANVEQDIARRIGVRARTDMEHCEAQGRQVLCLAPDSYVSAIGFNYWLKGVARPLKGLGIGQQKAWLAKAAAEGNRMEPSLTLAQEVLRFDATHPGDAEASVQVDSRTWERWAALAVAEEAQLLSSPLIAMRRGINDIASAVCGAPVERLPLAALLHRLDTRFVVKDADEGGWNGPVEFKADVWAHLVELAREAQP